MNFTFLHEIADFQRDKYPNERAFCEEVGNHRISNSIQEFIELRSKIKKAFQTQGVQKGDHCVICSRTGSALWFATDMAAMSVGMITVPLYPNFTDEEFDFISNEIDPTYIFCDDQVIADRLIEHFNHKEKYITFRPSSKYKTMDHWLENVEGQTNFTELDLDQHDPATIIYTSGSTGMPKGVLLSHRNIVSNIKAIMTLIPITYRHTVASFLPLNHIFERMVVYTYIACGVEIHFIDPKTKILHAVQRIRPHFISSVPRVLEKLYNHIDEQMRNAGPFKRRLIKFARETGKKSDIQWYKKPRQWLGNLVSDLIYRQWRKAIGGRLLGIIVGAAAMDPQLARLFTIAGIPIKEGYGLTETSPVVSFNRFEPGGTKLGTVGIPIPGVEVKIVKKEDEEEGEILVKGPNVMMGYYNNPEQTKKVIDQDGWFHTGDVGKWINERFLIISGREKDIYKTSSGQYVYPARIEQLLHKPKPIDQCMVIGFQRPYVGALIVPDFEYLMIWCAKHGVHWTSPMYMVLNDKVLELYQSIIDEINKNLRAHERIKTFALVSQTWSVDDGQITPTQKLKRKEIATRHQKAIQEMYENKRR